MLLWHNNFSYFIIIFISHHCYNYILPQQALSRDYETMNNMIYGDTPDFGVILEYLGTLEQEIHILNNV